MVLLRRLVTTHMLGACVGAFLTVVVLAVARPLDGATLGVLLSVAIVVLAMLTAATILVVASRRLQRQARRSSAIAIAAQRVGLAIDANEVAGAVLRAAQEVFSDIDFGGVLVYDREAEALRPLSVSLRDGEIADHGTGFNIPPGEGIAGKVFLSGEMRGWGSQVEVERAHQGMRGRTREKIAAVTGGVKSGAAAPLELSGRGVIGVLTLGSSTRESAWSAEDMVVLQGLAEQAALGVERARMYQEQRIEAMTDPLTGLANYRQLKSVVGSEVARARRGDSRLAIIFCDLDGFKSVNDRFGHSAGDGVLRLFARSMGEVLRTEDLAARYGGDEFVCVLPGADGAQAEAVSGRIRARFLDLLREDEELRAVTTHPSYGCAIYPEHGDAAEELLVAADSALMNAKRAMLRVGEATG